MPTELKLSVQLVPQPLWGRNLRSTLAPADWARISAAVRKRNKGMCEICGQGKAVHCHEEWEYDRLEEVILDGKPTQILRGLKSVCRACHMVHHMGRTMVVEGHVAMDNAIEHLAQVNEWSIEYAQKYTWYQFAVHRELSSIPLRGWAYDISALDRIPEAQFLTEVPMT